MNLLIVTADLPRPATGASARNYFLLKALARQHTVSLLTLVHSSETGTSVDISLLEGLVRTVQVIHRPTPYSKRWRQLMNLASGKSYLLNMFILPEMQKALNAMLAREHYDAVLFESVLIAGYRVPKDVKVILDQYDILYELQFRTYQNETAWLRKLYSWFESRLLKQTEIERCQKADAILVTSERERLVMKDLLPENIIEVVPNGVDIETFYGCSSKREVPNQLIFTGTMDYYPNINAVLFFAQRCWPLIKKQIPGTTWQIVGRNPPLEIRKLAEIPGITVTGTVPDIRPYLAASSVAIVPLQIGSGTRIKILEALAMQKAVVSTSVGCEGLSLVPGQHLIVADQPGEIVQAVVTLMNNREMRDALGTAGRKVVETEYSWEECGDRLLRILVEREREFVC